MADPAEKMLAVNGEPRRVRAETLAALLDELGYGGQVVATAVNGAFAPAAARDATKLAPGDQVEILAPMQGG